MAVVSQTVRWFRTLAFALVACVAPPSAAIAGVNDEPPPPGPSVIWLRPGLAVILDEERAAVVGDAQMNLQACASLDECAVPAEEGADDVVLVDQSPLPASAPSEAAASEGGAAPR